MLDPAGYGTVPRRGDSIGRRRGWRPSGLPGNSLHDNTGASAAYHLRGLTIEGHGSGVFGIQFNTGGNLAIENCVIRDFGTFAINIAPSTSSSFLVSNTIASNGNTGPGSNGAPTPEEQARLDQIWEIEHLPFSL